jgi:uncharacterized protein YjiS (DUF1127 family)
MSKTQHEIMQLMEKVRFWVDLLDIWRRRLRDRQRLLMMTDKELKDIGLTRYDVKYEARKPFWRE